MRLDTARPLNRTALVALVAILSATASSCATDREGDSGPRVDGAPLGVEGAHEHGVARMGLAVDGPIVTLDLQAPGEAVFGFEHEPVSDKDRKVIAQTLANIRAEAGSILSLPVEVSCEAGTVEILEAPATDDAHDHSEEAHAGPAEEEAHSEHEGDGQGHAHSEDGDEAEEQSHSEVHISVAWTCSESPEGRFATLELARLFDDVELVDLTVITSEGQAAGRVGADASFRF